jgi:hypothetical protein
VSTPAFLHAFRPFGGRGERSIEKREIGLAPSGAAEAATYCPIFCFVRDAITQHSAIP